MCEKIKSKHIVLCNERVPMKLASVKKKLTVRKIKKT